jgi:Ribbon-helix-helix protein, copG family
MAKRQGSETATSEAPEETDGKSGSTHVISVRLPSMVAELVDHEAASRGIRPSDLVRLAVEEFVRKPGVAGITANGSGTLRVPADLSPFESENTNPVVQPSDVVLESPEVVAIGF